MLMKQLILVATLAAACGLVAAKLPAPVLDDAAKAKAAEAAAKTAWQGKVDNWLLCKSQDKVAAFYRKTSGKAAPVAPAAAAARTPVASAAAPPAMPAASGAMAAAPVKAAPPPPCADPGAFAYVPPERKPLEAAGAHSPPATATSPPSTNVPAAAMAPAKKS